MWFFSKQKRERAHKEGKKEYFFYHDGENLIRFLPKLPSFQVEYLITGDLLGIS